MTIVRQRTTELTYQEYSSHDSVESPSKFAHGLDALLEATGELQEAFHFSNDLRESQILLVYRTGDTRVIVQERRTISRDVGYRMNSFEIYICGPLEESNCLERSIKNLYDSEIIWPINHEQ